MRKRALDPDEELSRALIALALARPFFGHLAQRVPRVWSDAIDAPVALARHGLRMQLVVNPDRFLALARTAHRTAHLEHELLHLVLRHPLRVEGRDRARFSVAADLVVNAMLASDAPPDAITLDRFPDFPIEATAETYDALLRDREPLPEAVGDDRGWTGADPLLELELARWCEQAAQRTGARAVAQLPEPIRAAIASAIEARRPSIDWRRVLRVFAASARRSRLEPTLRRPSKRYGTFPGSRVRRFARLAVALDTSASIDADDLAALAAELRGMHRTGAEITVIECDDRVRRTYAFDGALPSGVAGGGGTDFDPVFAWLDARTTRFDACIYLTDGVGPRPSITPRGCRVLWLWVGDEGLVPPFGRVIQLKSR